MKPDPCPHCGEPLKRVRIVYGYPTLELEARARRGEVVLGGCVIDPYAKWACRACGEPVAASPPHGEPLIGPLAPMWSG